MSENKNITNVTLLFVKHASLIKETTKSFQVLSGFGFPLHRFVPFKRMRRGRYAEFPPLTILLYRSFYYLTILTILKFLIPFSSVICFLFSKVSGT